MTRHAATVSDGGPAGGPSRDQARGQARGPGVLAGMRIRKKLLVLHTSFSLGLAVILLAALWPPLNDLTRSIEVLQAETKAELGTPGEVGEVEVAAGDADEMELEPAIAEALRSRPGRAIVLPGSAARAAAFRPDLPEGGQYVVTTARLFGVRNATDRVLGLMILAVVAVYALVVIALEVFVLPRAVYGPIGRMLEAEQAVQQGRTEDELIPEAAIPSDELGEIMHFRNRSIEKLRAQERELEEAFSRLEVVANDLKRKNHLLETAKQNLADADRLASLGMMSAGIAHELNTPLAVIKGIVEQMQAAPDEPLPTKRSQLMLRVVNRLERLSEGLLDFARVRPPSYEPALVAELADEAIELVRLERRGPDVQLVNDVDRNLGVRCDADRMVQVLVNLIRNSVDAVKGRPAASVAVSAEIGERDGEPWVSINVTDNGPGIDRGVLPNVFEPFVSTKLDSRGSGLGLAVAEGIVREHGGVILAANRAATSGAVFEIMLPAQPGEAPSAEATQE